MMPCCHLCGHDYIVDGVVQEDLLVKAEDEHRKWLRSQGTVTFEQPPPPKTCECPCHEVGKIVLH